jgi:hypothetical protein
VVSLPPMDFVPAVQIWSPHFSVRKPYMTPWYHMKKLTLNQWAV